MPFLLIHLIPPNPGSDINFVLRNPFSLLNTHVLSFRQCSLKDISLLKSIGYQSYQEHYMYLWTEVQFAEWYMNLSFSEESLRKQMNNPKTSFFLIYSNDQPVGLFK